MTLLPFAYLVVSYHVRAAYEVRRYLLNMYQFAPAAKEMWHYFYSHVNFHLLYIEKRVLFSIADNLLKYSLHKGNCVSVTLTVCL